METPQKSLVVADLEVGDLFVTGPGRYMYVRVLPFEANGVIGCKEAVSGEAQDVAARRECERPTAADFNRAAVRVRSCWSREECATLAAAA